jgi:hypothetical protein
MPTPNKMTATCGNCGEPRDIDVWNGINIGEHPELKEQVKDGSLFVWECPHCGERNLAPYQALYHDPAEHLMIWHIPENTVTEEQIASVTAQLKDLEGYVLRRVDDIGSLIEKVNLFDAGLDDVVLEMCKYVTKMELTGASSETTEPSPAEGSSPPLSPEDPEAIRQAPFKFYKLDGPDNDLIFSYPLNGEMRGVKIGFQVYGDCQGIVSRNPVMTPDPGFARIDAAWLESFFG